jgi:hypothetical protein
MHILACFTIKNSVNEYSFFLIRNNETGREAMSNAVPWVEMCRATIFNLHMSPVTSLSVISIIVLVNLIITEMLMLIIRSLIY